LISGRQLESIALPDDAGVTNLTAIVLGGDTLFVLDSAGRRIFVRAPKSATLRTLATLPQGITPTGLAYAPDTLYVGHAAGLLRLAIASGEQRPVSTAKGINANNLHSLAWQNGILLAIQQRDDGLATVRVRLNARGTAITAVESLESAAALAATVARGVYYYLVDGSDGTMALRARPLAP
jgi:hypothetical protein